MRENLKDLLAKRKFKDLGIIFHLIFHFISFHLILIFHLGIIVFIMIDQINELPKDGLKSSPETSCYTENKWISRKNQNKVVLLTPYWYFK